MKNKLSSLTVREREVLELLTNGESTRELAERLGVSPRTIQKHLQRIYAKLSVKRRMAADNCAVANQNRVNLSDRETQGYCAEKKYGIICSETYTPYRVRLQRGWLKSGTSGNIRRDLDCQRTVRINVHRSLLQDTPQAKWACE